MIILCYSYKGGSGRSTASVNIAASFLKKGKNVCLIDFDIENPGLHEIFGIDKVSDIDLHYYIQDLIRSEEINSEGKVIVPSSIPLEEFIKGGIIDMEKILKGTYKSLFEKNNKFLFIPASKNPADVIALKGRDAEDSLLRLIEYLREKNGIDYFVIDGANGIRSTSLVPMAISDVILIFFKWSKQHLAGTIETYKWINIFKDEVNFKADVYLVPSSVPKISKDSKDSRYLNTVYKESKTNLSKATNIEIQKILNFEIPEYPILKWDEKIVVGLEDYDNTSYEHIAEYIENKCRENI